MSKRKPAEKKAEKSKKKRTRNWTKDETELFATVLADPDENFSDTLEKKSPKKQATAEVFESILSTFATELSNPDFIGENEKNNLSDKKGNIIEYEHLDLTVASLQYKYKKLKQKWTDITNDAKGGSGLKGSADEGWYNILNPVLAENRTVLDSLASEPLDLSLIEEGDENTERNMDAESDTSSGSESNDDLEDVQEQAKKKM